MAYKPQTRTHSWAKSQYKIISEIRLCEKTPLGDRKISVPRNTRDQANDFLQILNMESTSSKNMKFHVCIFSKSMYGKKKHSPLISQIPAWLVSITSWHNVNVAPAKQYRKFIVLGQAFLKIRRHLRASSVGEYMVQASSQQSQEAKHCFQQAQQASDPASQLASQAASQLAAEEPAGLKPRSRPGIEQRFLWWQRFASYRSTRASNIRPQMHEDVWKSMKSVKIEKSMQIDENRLKLMHISANQLYYIKNDEL